jgi:hypothetical protein
MPMLDHIPTKIQVPVPYLGPMGRLGTGVALEVDIPKKN